MDRSVRHCLHANKFVNDLSFALICKICQVYVNQVYCFFGEIEMDAIRVSLFRIKKNSVISTHIS